MKSKDWMMATLAELGVSVPQAAVPEPLLFTMIAVIAGAVGLLVFWVLRARGRDRVEAEEEEQEEAWPD